MNKPVKIINEDLDTEILDYIESIEQQVLEAKARVARLEDGFKVMDKTLISMGIKGTVLDTVDYQKMLKLINESPAQSLAVIQAEAIEKAISSVAESIRVSSRRMSILNPIDSAVMFERGSVLASFDMYVKDLRNSAKEN